MADAADAMANRILALETELAASRAALAASVPASAVTVETSPPPFTDESAEMPTDQFSAGDSPGPTPSPPPPPAEGSSVASSSGLAPLSAPTPSDTAPAADRSSPPASISDSVGALENHETLLSSSRSEDPAVPSTSVATSADGREASSGLAPPPAPVPLAPASAAALSHSSPASSISDGVDATGTSTSAPVLLTDLRGSSLDVSASSRSSAGTAAPMVAMQARLDQERAYATELEARHRLLLASTDAAAADAQRVQRDQIQDLTEMVAALTSQMSQVRASAPAPPPVSYSTAAAPPDDRRRTITTRVVCMTAASTGIDDLKHKDIEISAAELRDMPGVDTVPILSFDTDLEAWAARFLIAVAVCPNVYLRGHLFRQRMAEDLKIPVEAELFRIGVRPGDMVPFNVMMRTVCGAFDAARPARYQAAADQAFKATMKRGKFDVYAAFVDKALQRAGIDTSLPDPGTAVTERLLAAQANFLRLALFTGMDPGLRSELAKVEGLHQMPFADIRKLASRLDSSLTQQRTSTSAPAETVASASSGTSAVTWEELEDGEVVGYVGSTRTGGQMDDATFRKPWDNIKSYVKANPKFHSCKFCLKNKGAESKARIAAAARHSAPFCEHLYFANVGKKMTSDTRSRVLHELKEAGYQLPN